jgi:hypothetical protein
MAGIEWVKPPVYCGFRIWNPAEGFHFRTSLWDHEPSPPALT